ncbi:MAG: hypothetical protein ACLFNQ_02910 [Spirochaetaceae bacterium]
MDHFEEDDLLFISETLPNDEATEAETALFERIADRIRARTDEGDASAAVPTVRGIEHVSAVSGHSFSESLHVHIAGRSSSSVLVLVPVNSPPYVQDLPFGAPGIAAAVELILQAVTDPLDYDLHVVFGTASRRNTPLLQESLIQFFEDSPPLAVIVLDILVPDDQMEIVSGSPGVVSPRWLVSAAQQAFREHDLSAGARGGAEQLFRVGARPSGRDYLVEPFLTRDIPSILVVDGTTARESWQNDPPARLLRVESFAAIDAYRHAGRIHGALRTMIQDLAEIDNVEWDRNAIRYSVEDVSVVVGETAYLIFLLVAIGLVFAYGVTHRQALARYIRTIRKNILSLPLLFGMSYLFLLLFGWLSNSILFLRGTPELASLLPVSLFGFKFFGAFLLLQITYLTARKLPLSRNGSFYSAASVLVLIVSVFVFGSVSIATTAPFVAALLATVLFTVSPSRPLKIIFLVLAIIPPATLTYSFLLLEEGSVVQELVSDPLMNVLPTLIVLPYLMLLIRVDFLIRHPVSGGRSFAMKILTAVVASGLILSAIQLSSAEPFSAEQVQRVRVTERSDVTTSEATVTVQSIAETRSFSLRYDGADLAVPLRSPRTEHSVPFPDRHLDISVEEETFLARRIVDITIRSDVRFVELAISLISDDPVLVYQASLPFRTSASGNRIDILPGRNPPSPMRLRIIIPVESSPDIEVTSTLAEVQNLSVRHDEPVYIHQRALQTVRLPLLDGGSPR